MVGWTTKSLFALGRVECGAMCCEVSRSNQILIALTLPVVMLIYECEYRGNVVGCIAGAACQVKMRLIGGSIKSTIHRLGSIG